MEPEAVDPREEQSTASDGADPRVLPSVRLYRPVALREEGATALDHLSVEI